MAIPGNLENGDFEGVTSPGGWTRDVWGNPPIGEIYAPEGWTIFFRENEGDLVFQPEIHVIPFEPPFVDPPRVSSGNWSVKAFKTYGRIDCGMLQHLTGLTPGATYRFSFWAHSWSLHKGIGPCTDHNNPRCSSGVGEGGHFLFETEAPELNGDPVNDAISNILYKAGVKLGKDPDPFGSGIAWAEGAYIYNVFGQVPGIEFVADQTGEATVYIWTKARWAYLHTDSYIDLAELELISEPTGPPCVREQYDKTSVLLKHDVRGKEWAQVVVEEMWEEHGLNLNSSADDASGPNCLDDRHVVAVNPQDWTGEAEDLVDFRDEHYPDAEMTLVEVATPEELRMYLRGEAPNKWDKYLLEQRDPEWVDEDLAFDCNLTIGESGCYTTCEAMAQRIYDINPNATPVTVRDARGPGGFSGCNARRDQADETLGFEEFIAGQATVDAHLAEGGVAMAEVLPTSLQHFVLIVEKRGEDYLCLDPWHGYVGLIKEQYLGWESFRMMVPVEEPTPTPDPYTLTGYHMQRPFTNWIEYIERLYEAAQPLKWLFIVHEGMENIHIAREKSPGIKGAYRLIISQSEQGDYLDWAWDGDPIEAATHYWNRFGEAALRNKIDAVVSLNETFGVNQLEEIRKTVKFDIAFCQVVYEASGGTIAPVVLVAPPGNPEHGAEVEMLIPAAEASVQYGGYIGAHTYFPATPDRARVLKWIREEGIHYHMRPQLSWDPVFRASGIFASYLGLEGGGVAAYVREDGRPGGFITSGAGWRHEDALNGDLNLYAECLSEINLIKMNWNATHSNRTELEAIFSSGRAGWGDFQVNENEWPVIFNLLVPGW